MDIVNHHSVEFPFINLSQIAILAYEIYNLSTGRNDSVVQCIAAALIYNSDKEKICHGNTEAIFRL